MNVVIGLLLGAISVFLFLYPRTKTTIKLDTDIQKENDSIRQQNSTLQQQQDLLVTNLNDLDNKKSEIIDYICQLNAQAAEIIKQNKVLTNQKDMLSQENTALTERKKNIITSIDELQQQAAQSADAFYQQALNAAKDKLTFEVKIEKDRLDTELEDFKRINQNTIDAIIDETARQVNEKRAEIESIQNELDEINKSYKAVVDAQRREKEIKEKQNFYCLRTNEIDKGDIKMIEAMKPRLSKPRVLSMVIWSTYYQKPMNTLCANVLGTKTITGIYKITNQQTDECYIGQSVDVADRWKQHAKCGLDIDRPQGNKLYKAMIEYGLDSFSWELLEECSKDKLDERERYYIELYHAVDFGYNSTKGNNGGK